MIPPGLWIDCVCGAVCAAVLFREWWLRAMIPRPRVCQRITGRTARGGVASCGAAAVALLDVRKSTPEGIGICAAHLRQWIHTPPPRRRRRGA